MCLLKSMNLSDNLKYSFSPQNHEDKNKSKEKEQSIQTPLTENPICYKWFSCKSTKLES